MSEEHRRPTILLVDDDPAYLASIEDGLGLALPKINLVSARDGREALELIGSQPVDLLITDLGMPVMDGMELLETLHLGPTKIPVIVVSALASDSIRRSLRRYRPLAVIDKPVDLDQLAASIQRAISALDQPASSLRQSSIGRRFRPFSFLDPWASRPIADSHNRNKWFSGTPWWVPRHAPDGGL